MHADALIFLHLDPDPLRFPLWIWYQICMLHLYIRKIRFIQVEGKSVENHGKGNVKLGESKTIDSSVS